MRRWVIALGIGIVAGGCFVDRQGLGGAPDSGTAADSGPAFDAGPFFDAGRPSDAGRDAATRFDAGRPRVDAGPRDAGLRWNVVETLTIDCRSPAEQTSSTVLGSGSSWRLRASGTCMIGFAQCDADYFGFLLLPTDALLGSDPGIGVNDPTVDGDTRPDWGPYNSGHVYEIPFSGTDAQIGVRLHDGSYENNSGSLTLEILQLR